jgi:hypothetical protein
MKKIFVSVIAFFLISIGCIVVGAFFVLFARFVSIGWEGVLSLFHLGWSGKLNLNSVEKIVLVLGLSSGGGLGIFVWYLFLTNFGFYTRSELDHQFECGQKRKL